MALFGKNKKKKKQTTEVSDSKSVSEVIARSRVVLLRPHVTEKAANLMDKGVYTFDIVEGANKIEVKKAVKEMYDVAPVKVRIARTPGKRKMRQNSVGRSKGVKKAYVTLKDGDTIELF